MTRQITIVMYHFVRQIAGSRWSGIKGLELSAFRQQVAYMMRHYTIVGLEDIVEDARGGRPLPLAPAVLTFDDGYAEHYHEAMPVLASLGVKGAFFPPSSAVQDRCLLDVNKVHFILAASNDPHRVVVAMDEMIEEARGEFELDSLAGYRKKYWEHGTFDPPEILYIKRTLQKGLPENLRSRITDTLFRRHVSNDEQSFADELYVSEAQLVEMVDAGMEIGSHGHSHHWLNSLDVEAQAQDIDRSLDMLEAIGVGRTGFFFCYPYGAYNEATLSVLRNRNCAAAITTDIRLAQHHEPDLLQLPRLDTNDLPKEEGAKINSWTRSALYD